MPTTITRIFNPDVVLEKIVEEQETAVQCSLRADPRLGKPTRYYWDGVAQGLEIAKIIYYNEVYKSKQTH